MAKTFYLLRELGFFRLLRYMLLYPLRSVQWYAAWASDFRSEKRSHLHILKRVNDDIIEKRPLSDTRKREIRDYYQGFGMKINTRWHEACYALNGTDSNRYLSEFLFYQYIEPHFNDIGLHRGFGDKNLYQIHFPGFSQPRTILRFMRNRFYDESYRVMDADSAFDRLHEQSQPAIIKPSLKSGRGRNVRILSVENRKMYLNGNRVDLADLIRLYQSGFIVQELVNQHEALKALNSHSLNTIKLVTFRFNHDVIVLSAMLRTAADEYHLDSVNRGGLFCGIDPEGFVKSVAFDKSFEAHRLHPYSKVTFGDVKIPDFKRLKDSVCDMHKMNFYCDIASWDISVHRSGEPVLIETNLKNQGILLHQIVNGPLFGERTEEVLRNVFKD